MLLVGRPQVFGEAAEARPAFGVDADEANGADDRRAVHFELEHGEDFDGGRHGFDAVVEFRVGADEFHLAFGVGEAGVVPGLDDDVGKGAVQAVAQLGAKAGHDAVDHDERGHAQQDADDADQGQVARQQIAPAEQQLVHGHLLHRRV